MPWNVLAHVQSAGSSECIFLGNLVVERTFGKWRNNLQPLYEPPPGDFAAIARTNGPLLMTINGTVATAEPGNGLIVGSGCLIAL